MCVHEQRSLRGEVHDRSADERAILQGDSDAETTRVTLLDDEALALQGWPVALRIAAIDVDRALVARIDAGPRRPRCADDDLVAFDRD